MRLAVLVLLCVPLLAGCGGWHPLYADPSSGTPVYDNFTATTSDGVTTVTSQPATGPVLDGTIVTFTVSPSLGTEVVSYSINGGEPVAFPGNPGSGQQVSIQLPITSTNWTVEFNTIPVSTNG